MLRNFVAALVVVGFVTTVRAQRHMENLGRGVVCEFDHDPQTGCECAAKLPLRSEAIRRRYADGIQSAATVPAGLPP